MLMNVVMFLSVIVLVLGSFFMCQTESRNEHGSHNHGIIEANSNGPKKDANFYGATSLDGGSYGNINVYGAGTLKNIKAVNLTAKGGVSIENSTIEKSLDIKGGVTLKKVTVYGPFAGSGGMTLEGGFYSSVTAHGGCTIEEAEISKDLDCNGGLTITDSSVGGDCTIKGGLTAENTDFDKNIEMSFAAGESEIKNCNVKGSVFVKKSRLETGWAWKFFSWVSSKETSKQELKLHNTIVEGDITFEDDSSDVERIVHVSGTTEIKGQVKGAKVIKGMYNS